MQISELWKNPPKLHKAMYKPGDSAINWGLTKAILEWVEKNVIEDFNVLETGSGFSTIACLALGANVDSIDPSPVTFGRIEAYAKEQGVPLTKWTPHNKRSEKVLPTLVSFDPMPQYDLCILDGSHTFPTPFVDYFYMSQLVKVGGLILIDDAYKLPVCRFLMQWMHRLPEWESVERVTRSHIFRKKAQIDHPDRFCEDPGFNINWRDGN